MEPQLDAPGGAVQAKPQSLKEAPLVFSKFSNLLKIDFLQSWFLEIFLSFLQHPPPYIPAPKHISEFYLGAFFAQLQQEGYTIFVVRGTLPRQDTLLGQTGEYGRWVEPAEAIAVRRGRLNTSG